MKNKKIGLIGTEYHSKKIERVIQEEGMEADYIKLEPNIILLINILRSYDAFYVTYTQTTFKFILFFIIPAFCLRKKIYFQWIGSDVLDLKFSKFRFIRTLIINNLTVNLCECTWIKEELRELGINAKLGPYITFSEIFNLLKIKPKNENNRGHGLIITTYAPKGREELYSLNDIIELARENSSITFNVVAHNGDGYPNLSNVVFHGWLPASELEKIYHNSDVFIRMTKHDGLSYSVLEAMAIGLQVIFSYSYPYTQTAINYNQLQEIIHDFQCKKEQGEDMFNHQGVEYIKREFIETRVSENNIIALLNK